MKHRRTLTRLMAFLLVFLFAAFAALPPLSVRASEEGQSSQEKMDDLNQKLKELRERMDALEKGIEDGKTTAEQAQQRKAYYEQEAALLEQQIALKIAQIEGQEQDIADKQAEIVAKQAELDENDRLFRQRLLAIYKMNDASVLSTLLSVDSFSEFLTISRNLQSISAHDVELLETLEAQRVDLESAKAEMDAMLAALEDERTALDATMAEYQNSIAQAQAAYSNAMAQVAQQEQDLEASHDEYVKAQEELEEVWRTLANQGSNPQYIGGALEWPVPSHNGDQYISSHFGWRTLYGRPNLHGGMDIARGPTASIDGASIVAANGGKVVYVVANSNVGYGNYVIVDHGGGIKTLYAHCSSIAVSVGQDVSRGQHIATVGNTGNSTGPHLHFELRLRDTEKVDPYPYLTHKKDLG